MSCRQGPMRNRSCKNCEQCEKRVAAVGIWANLVMVVLKLYIGVTSGSKACIADGLHSASCIITAFAILISQRVGKKKSSGEFPYGFGKIEFIAAGFISLLICVFAVLLISVSIRHLMNTRSTPPHFSAVLMALFSIGVNEMLFRYMRCVGHQFKSQSILASAWSNRADAFSSLAVIFGVLGSKMGLTHLDPIAALFVVAVIIKMSITILRDSIKALMDGSVNHVYRNEIRMVVESMKEIHKISDIKSRQVGQKIWIDLDILVDPKCSMAETNIIAERVRKKLVTAIPDLERVQVHFGPMEPSEC